MKIIHIVTGFDINYPGGITNYVRNLNIALNDSYGLESKLVFSEGDGDFAREVTPDLFLSVDKMKRFSFKFSNRGKDDGLFSDFLAREKPDVIHFHTIYGLSESILNFINNSGYKYVISVHDYYIACPRIYMVDRNGLPCRSVIKEKCKSCLSLLEYSDFLRKASEKFHIKLPLIKSDLNAHRNKLMQHFLDKAARILPVSTRVGEIIKDLTSNKLITVLTIGNESADRFRKRERCSSEFINLAFIGTLNKNKGGDLFIDIVNKLKSVSHLKFHFYGRAEAKYADLLRDSGVNNHGGYKPSELPTILDGIDMGMVLPIWEDNGPQVVMEFINNGVPVIGTSVGGIPDFVKHQDTGYLFHPDINEEIDRVIDYIRDINRDDIEKLAGNIEPLKTVAMHTNEMVEMYKGIIKGT